MGRTLEKVFHLCFGLLAAGLLALSVLQWQANGAAALGAAAVLGLLVWAAGRWLLPLAERLSRRGWHRLLAGLAAAYLALLLAAGFLLRCQPIMDWETVWKTLPDLLDNFYLNNADNAGYYMVCANNIGLGLLLAGWYSLLGPLGIAPVSEAGLNAGVVLNCLAIWAAVLLLIRAVWLLAGTRRAVLLAALLAALFLPFYLYAPVFYSDTLALPFVSGAAVLFLRAMRAGRGAARVLWCAALGVCCFLGCAVKGSLAVLVVACGLALLLRLDRATLGLRLRQLAALLAAFLVLTALYKGWQNVWLDWEWSESFRFPTSLWFCYGSHDSGDYSQADVDDALALPTLEERDAMLRARIRDNYTARTAGQNAAFLAQKAARTWGDGLYDAQEYLVTPLKANFTVRFVLPGQPGAMPLAYCGQSVQLLLLGLLAAGSLLALRGPHSLRDAFVARVSLFGVMLFLSFWETKARYALHFAPFLLLCAALAVEQLLQIRKEKHKA